RSRKSATRGATANLRNGSGSTPSPDSSTFRTSATSRPSGAGAAVRATATSLACRRCIRRRPSPWGGAPAVTCRSRSRATASYATIERGGGDPMSEQMNRRRFLTVLGVTGGGAAAVSACGSDAQRTQKLIPYLIQPEEQVPGTATWYATTCRECTAGCGLHAKVREGGVVKLEGNPESPTNEGRLCSRGKAALQGLYNPDPVTDPMARGPNGAWQKLTWDDAIGRLATKVKEARGRGIVFVTGLESG